MFNWTAFLTYIIIMSVTPGPNNIMSMTHASRMGFKKSYPFNLGVFAGALIVMLLSTFFSNLLYSYIPKVAPFMLFIGAGYMLYLAYKIFTSGKDFKPSRMTDARFSTAVLLQFINPKLYIYSVTAMGSYILPYYQERVTLFFFTILLTSMGFLSTILWALFGSLFRKLFSEHARLVNTIMALLLVYTAVSLFF
ncbi:LysE family transporter [Proteiniclasticum sp.]|uniref:LysE family transporter n=1 Tax=Proteiniclasticum sp. TaxID=2053595 RepID=UPI0028A1B5B2|nr:LysE family transporter [Proteiniclasticum sp.]